MATEVAISVSTASQTLNITTSASNVAISPTAATTDVFEPQPVNNYQFTHVPKEIYSLTNTTGEANIGSFDLAGAVNVTMGSLPYSQISKELDGFKYVFPNFESTGIVNLDNFVAGDIVYFASDTSGTANAYGSTLEKINLSSTSGGAYNNLMLFLSYTGTTLTLLHKGYFDFSNSASNITNWTAGRTLYLNSSGDLDTTPTSTSGHWVKSLGFCIPNTISAKRIWFESDSTYLKLI
jgi:hypothetical protein